MISPIFSTLLAHTPSLLFTSPIHPIYHFSCFLLAPHSSPTPVPAAIARIIATIYLSPLEDVAFIWLYDGTKLCKDEEAHDHLKLLIGDESRCSKFLEIVGEVLPLMEGHLSTLSSHYCEELANKQAVVTAAMPGEETDANFVKAFKKKQVEDLKSSTARLIATLEDAAADMVSLGQEPGAVSGYSEGEKTKLAAEAQVVRWTILEFLEKDAITEDSMKGKSLRSHLKILYEDNIDQPHVMEELDKERIEKALLDPCDATESLRRRQRAKGEPSKGRVA